MMRGIAGTVLVAAGLFLSACASTSPSGDMDANDPYESTNRTIFEMNGKVDRAVILPTAKFYVAVVPEPARDGVHNFIENLDEPVTFANDLLQGDFKAAGKTFVRFGLNTTVGLGGIFDATEQTSLARRKEDFGQTLGVWGVGEGPYMVLPILGPSPPRDSAGRLGDIVMDPFTWITIREHFWWSAGRFTATAIDLRSRNIDTLEGLERSSVDYYATVRSAYRQSREDDIHNGKTDVKDLPDF